MIERRFVRVPVQVDQFARVVDAESGGAWLVFGPAAAAVRAAAGGPGGELVGDWRPDAREVHDATEFAPAPDPSLPEERMGQVFVPEGGGAPRFVVAEGRHKGKAYALPASLAAELRPLVEGTSGTSRARVFVTGVWDDATWSVTPTAAHRVATVGDGLEVLAPSETGRSEELIVGRDTAARSRELVSAGGASWTPPSDATAYNVDATGGYVPMALQFGAITSSGDLHPAVLAERDQLARVLEGTAAARGTSTREEVDRIAARFEAQGVNPAQLAELVGGLEQTLGLSPRPSGGVPWGLVAAGALGFLLLRR